MAQRPVTSRQNDATRVLDGGFWLVVVMAAMLGVLVIASGLAGAMQPNATPGGRRVSPRR